MDRYWLLTWTTFGSWLPGDSRGSTSPLRERDFQRERYNVFSTPAGPPQPELERYARANLASPSVRLTGEQAAAVVARLHAVALDRGWFIFACAVMSNHVHVVVGVAGDPDPADLLRDFKRSTSRALSRMATDKLGRSWWTKSGSKRKLVDEPHVRAAVNYVMHQWHPLAVYKDPDW